MAFLSSAYNAARDYAGRAAAAAGETTAALQWAERAAAAAGSGVAAAVSGAVTRVISSWGKKQLIQETEINFRARMVLHEISRDEREINLSSLIEKVRALELSINYEVWSTTETRGCHVIYEFFHGRALLRNHCVSLEEVKRGNTQILHSTIQKIHKVCLAILEKELHEDVKKILLTQNIHEGILQLKQIYTGSILDLPFIQECAYSRIKEEYSKKPEQQATTVEEKKTIREQFSSGDPKTFSAIIDLLDLSEIEKESLIFSYYYLKDNIKSDWLLSSFRSLLGSYGFLDHLDHERRSRLELIDKLLKKGANFYQHQDFPNEMKAYIKDLYDHFQRVSSDMPKLIKQLENMILHGYHPGEDYGDIKDDTFLELLLPLCSPEAFIGPYILAIDYGANPNRIIPQEKIHKIQEFLEEEKKQKSAGEYPSKMVLPKNIELWQVQLIRRWNLGIYKQAKENVQQAEIKNAAVARTSAAAARTSAAAAAGAAAADPHADGVAAATSAAADRGAAADGGAAANAPARQNSAPKGSRKTNPLMQAVGEAMEAAMNRTAAGERSTVPNELLALIASIDGYCPPEREINLEVKRLREEGLRMESDSNSRPSGSRADGAAAGGGGGAAAGVAAPPGGIAF